MINTKFISAGAGSGKTFSLTKEIAQLVNEGITNGGNVVKCRAEEIILTTFTESAARELREKVRSKLYAVGLYDAAMNIDNAAIGTIHSIAFKLVSRYWYLLGISANVTIMDDDSKAVCINQSLSSLPTDADIHLFNDILKSLNPSKFEGTNTAINPNFWKEELYSIIEKTTELCLTTEQLDEARDKSIELLTKILKWNGKDITTNDVATIKEYATLSLESSNNKDNINNIQKNLSELTSAIPIPIVNIYNLAGIIKSDAGTKKKHPHIITFFEELYEDIPNSVHVKNMVETYIDTIFRLAKKWKSSYEQFKRERCLLDFSDILQKFEELLQKEEVIDDIRSRYKVAFVDEYQDCSPLQVKSFKRLSHLMEQSVWVGDIKQAIYGFRGTNTELIQSIIDEAGKEKNGNKLDSLESCWRSNNHIINLVNNIFCEKVFKGQIDRKYIELKYPERTENDPPAPAECQAKHILLNASNEEKRYAIIAEIVKDYIDKGIYAPHDIAILCRTRRNVLDISNALKNVGIAYNAVFDNESKEMDEISSFINAVVSFAARSDNELSKAIVTNRIEEGYGVAKLLSDRLHYLETKVEDSKERWLDQVDVITRFNHLRETIGKQSVSAAIETLIIELNLADLIKRIEPTAPAYNYCSALSATAAKYENICSSLGLSCTLVGFVDYLKQHPVEYPGDDKGVNVMTYHKSKGLQWRCVLLCSLNSHPINPPLSYFGVLTNCTKDESALRLVPSALGKVCSKMYDRFAEHSFYRKYDEALINEAKRLMYVGMTRPKEQLAFVTNSKDGSDEWLTSIGCSSINKATKSSNGEIDWDGSILLREEYIYDAMEFSSTKTDVNDFKTLKQPKEREVFENKFITPSKIGTNEEAYKSVEQLDTFAERISMSASDKRDSTVGDFIHHAMCLWDGNRAKIEALAAAYGITTDIDSVVTSITSFWEWMERRYGKPRRLEQELPFTFANDKGQIITGEIDLVYHTDKGAVLVDYKSYQNREENLLKEDNKFYAGKYSGQIALYEEALKRSGIEVRDRLICYISLGKIFRFE